MIPAGTPVVFLGDGEFDGTRLQDTLREAGWWYACRTSKGNTVTWQGETFPVAELGACIKPGRLIELQEVAVTHEAYGPVLLLCCWAKGYVEPLYLVSNMSTAEEAIDYYQKRFRIETFFSDQKSRGFNIQKSHLTDPQRLSRLLLGEQIAKNIFHPLPELEVLVGIQDHGLHECLGLLTTRFPNGFDGQAP